MSAVSCGEDISPLRDYPIDMAGHFPTRCLALFRLILALGWPAGDLSESPKARDTKTDAEDSSNGVISSQRN
jgi:hypothetical protein